jgi:hypothetical protein
VLLLLLVVVVVVMMEGEVLQHACHRFGLAR